MLAKTDWNEVAMVMTIFSFVMVWILVFIKTGVKLRHQARGVAEPTSPLAAPVRSVAWRGLQYHLYVAVLVIVALSLMAPMAWVMAGPTGMPLVRLGTIGILLAAMYASVIGAIIGFKTISRSDRSRSDGSAFPYDPSMHASLVARITQRF